MIILRDDTIDLIIDSRLEKRTNLQGRGVAGARTVLVGWCLASGPSSQLQRIGEPDIVKCGFNQITDINHFKNFGSNRVKFQQPIIG